MSEPQHWRGRGRRWIQQWWEARIPRHDALELSHRNLYILPTRTGWAFAVVLLVLLLASINEQLNLGYGLTFLLGGTALVGLHQTHANLHGLHWQCTAPARVHAGQALALKVQVRNSHRRRARYGLKLMSTPERHVDIDVPADDTTDATLDISTTQRGAVSLPRLTLETRYPMGLFRAWAYWKPASQALVWPALDAHAPPLPTSGAHDPRGRAATSSAGRHGEPEGLRPYRRSDPMKWVAWKKSTQAIAGEGCLVSREWLQHQSPDLWLDLASTPGLSHLGIEARLSRLATWLLAAEEAAREGGAAYGLILGAVRIAPGRGPAHLQHCLDALAHHPHSGTSEGLRT